MGRDPLGAVIRRLLGNAQRDAHNILITPRLGNTEAAQLKLLLNKGVSILVVAMLWDEENSETAGLAAAMGAQRQAEGGRALALAVAGVDDHDAAALAFGFFVGLFARRGFNLHGVKSSRG